METDKVIRIGGLGPLSLPGIPWAGRELQAGMALAVRRLNDSGGVLGRPLMLLFEDTCGRRRRPLSRRPRHEVSAITSSVHTFFQDETNRGGRVTDVCMVHSW